MMYKKLVLIVFTLFAVSFSLKAQSLYIGPQAGWQKAANAETGKFIIGADFRYRLNDFLGADASVNYRQEFYNNNNLKVSSFPLMVSGLVYPLNLIPGIISPLNNIYGAIGAGWYNTNFMYSPKLNSYGLENETKNKFGWHYGAGIEIPFGGSENFPGTIFTADVRYVNLNYSLPALPGNPSLKNNFVVVTAGFLVKF